MAVNKQIFNGLVYGFRYQEDGVQDPPVARAVLRVLCVQECHRHQELHPTRAGDLLRHLLRGEVCYSMCQVRQGMYRRLPQTIVTKYFVVWSSRRATLIPLRASYPLRAGNLLRHLL